jgi:hypothetical protein
MEIGLEGKGLSGASCRVRKKRRNCRDRQGVVVIVNGNVECFLQ